MGLLVVFSALVIGVLADTVKYNKFAVFRAIPKDKKQLEFLENLNNEPGYSFFVGPTFVNNFVDVMVAPEFVQDFNKRTKKFGFGVTTLIENVQKAIDAEQMKIDGRNKKMDWESYHDLKEFEDWMTELEKKHKDIVKKFSIGKSFEKRDINALEITFKQGQPTVFIESGIHGREWIYPAVTSFLVEQILKYNSTLTNFNYIYVPFVNPDGYVYTWTTDRLWVKTRERYQKNKICYGADMNRNFEFTKNLTGMMKSRGDPCRNDYAGPYRFSEVESQAMNSFFANNAKEKNIMAYLSFHSYGKRIMFPYGAFSERFPRADYLMHMAKLMAGAIRKFDGAEFEVGDVYHVSGQMIGTTLDYFAAKHNITLPFAFALGDRKNETYFVSPKIISALGKEMMVAVLKMLTKP